MSNTTQMCGSLSLQISKVTFHQFFTVQFYIIHPPSHWMTVYHQSGWHLCVIIISSISVHLFLGSITRTHHHPWLPPGSTHIWYFSLRRKVNYWLPHS